MENINMATLAIIAANVIVSLKGFKEFCDRYLSCHAFFEKQLDIGENKHVFIFNLSPHKNDFVRFLEGKYSQFSLDSKLTILDFFSSSGKMLTMYNLFYLQTVHMKIMLKHLV